MKQRVKIISSYGLNGVEEQINDFLEDFPECGRDLIDVKILESNYNNRLVVMIIYAEEY